MKNLLFGAMFLLGAFGGTVAVFILGAPTTPVVAVAPEKPAERSRAPEEDPVVEVVDLNRALTRKATSHVEPKGLPFISYDEPPLAQPRNQTEIMPEVVRVVGFESVIETSVEVAPMPRPVVKTPKF